MYLYLDDTISSCGDQSREFRQSEGTKHTAMLWYGWYGSLPPPRGGSERLAVVYSCVRRASLTNRHSNTLLCSSAYTQVDRKG